MKKLKTNKNDNNKCINKRDCIIKKWVDGKEVIYQCENCSKIIKTE